MRLLLDTHIFLWCIKDDKRLSKATKAKIEHASDVYVSAASIWEMTIKVKLKKLDADMKLVAKAIEESGFTELPISVEHAMATSRLPDLHRDPFDRILLAQALVEPLIFLTADAQLKEYSKLVEVVS